MFTSRVIPGDVVIIVLTPTCSPVGISVVGAFAESTVTKVAPTETTATSLRYVSKVSVTFDTVITFPGEIPTVLLTNIIVSPIPIVLCAVEVVNIDEVYGVIFVVPTATMFASLI